MQRVLLLTKLRKHSTRKKDPKRSIFWCVQDQSRPPLRNTFDYEMTAEEFTKYGASLVDKVVELNIQGHGPEFRWAHADVGRDPQSRRVMETALTYTLQRVHWQFFGSLTFKSAKLPERVRVTMFFALVRCLCRWHKVPFRKCVWVLRQESGEISGRLHFHFLIAGLTPSPKWPSLLFRKSFITARCKLFGCTFVATIPIPGIVNPSVLASSSTVRTI
jgi:hypothetical protein